uniref:DUF7483 domain-containing protein n=1 Tax=Shewanella sp. TaxID=50422 RepID=UPI0040474C79
MSTPLGSSQWMYSSGEEVTQQSLKFNHPESQYLSWTPAAAGNRKISTFSAWVKLSLQQSSFSILGAGTSGSAYFLFGIEGDDLYWEATGGGGTRRSDMELRDPSGWYHLMFVLDTTQATANDRVKLYKNGVQVTSFSSIANPTQNADVPYLNNTGTHYIGYSPALPSTYGNGYLSDVYFIDGQALDPTSFGQFNNGYWEAKDYAGIYGTNGFHLTFADDVVSEGFNAVTYRGTGTSQSVSGLGLSPDLVWIKSRSGAYSHNLSDSVRGGNLGLTSNGTNAEYSLSPANTFDTDGFTLNQTNNQFNASGVTYVAWAWDAGSGSPVSNTDGSITSTVKANTAYGFSILNCTLPSSGNFTVGHGLSQTPDMFIFKRRANTSGWGVWHTGLSGGTYYILLESTGAQVNDSTVFSASPDSSVLNIGSAWTSSSGGTDAIAYAFHSVAGYSSIGSFTGNGSTLNSITGLGFKPAFLLIKNASVSSSWYIFDNTRDTDDVADKYLRPNISNAEGVLEFCEFTADGFDITSSAAEWNGSGNTILYMAFADTREAAFWKDVSGNNNHWTPNNLDYRDSLIDSPANNFATLNPLNAYRSGNVYSEGNLRAVPTSAYNLAYATMAQSTGKWYWEIYVEHRVSTNNNTAIGLEEMPASSSYLTKAYWDFGSTRNDGSIVASDGTYPSFATGDVISVAVDFDNGKLWFARNGSWINSGDPSAGTNNPLSTTVGSTYSPAFFLYYTATIPKFIANFGQDSTFSGARPAGGNVDDNGIGDFAYAPPSGYLALCTANLPTPSIVDGSEHFNTVLYSGTGATQSITGVGFQPDWVWLKDRTVSGRDHQQIDSVRGATKTLKSSTTLAEQTLNSVTSFDSDGFTVGNESGANASGSALVGWNWKAGGTAVSNTDGTITSQVSANVDAGFSIVSWVHSSTTSTIGHGLTTAPNLIILKSRTTAYNWDVGSDDIGWGNRMILNSTAASSGTAFWNSTAPTSSVFTYAGSGATNGDAMISYCFANSDTTKVGSYTGNGSTDGPYIHLGFRASWIMVKSTGASNWFIWDTSRNPYNATTTPLFPNSSSAEEATLYPIDILSNGFKLRGASGLGINESATYIYLAFAENPFKYANAR